MKKFVIFLSLFLFFLNSIIAISISKCSKNDQRQIILDTTHGQLIGSCDFVNVNDNNPRETKSGNVYSWKSVPYAEPPVGSLRFKRTVEKEPWSGALNALEWPNSCIQQNTDSETISRFMGLKMWKTFSNVTRFSEDCLYLNIWLPLDAYLRASQPSAQHSKPPILVFFHGGNLVKGSSVLDVYDPSTFVAASNTIVITVNYRLGIFGSLYLEGEFPGNQALYDQHEALKWIRNNAEKIGGDPNRITLVGHGAGASLVGLHLFYRDSWPLYNNMILQSGTPLVGQFEPIRRQEADRRTKQVLSYVNCYNETSTSSEMASCAQESDYMSRAGIDYLAHNNNNSRVSELYTSTLFPPVIDGYILQDSTINLLKNGHFNRCPLITGFNVDEGSLTIASSGLYDDFKKQPQISHANLVKFLSSYFQYYPQYPDRSNELILKSILHEYTKLTETTYDENDLSQTLLKPNYFQTLNKIIGHQRSICPTYKFADLVSKYNNKVYVYLYAHRLSSTSWPTWYGAVHGDELAFTFGHVIASGRDTSSFASPNPWANPKHRYTNLEKALASEIINNWANFAKYSNPNSPKIGYSRKWPEYSFYNNTNFNVSNYGYPGNYLIFKTNGTRAHRNFSLENCQFWNSYLPSIIQQNNLLINQRLLLQMQQQQLEHHLKADQEVDQSSPMPSCQQSPTSSGHSLNSKDGEEKTNIINNDSNKININSLFSLILAILSMSLFI